MSDRDVFEFSSPEMPAMTSNLFVRVRLLSVATLLTAFFAVGLIA